METIADCLSIVFLVLYYKSGNFNIPFLLIGRPIICTFITFKCVIHELKNG